MTLLGLAVGIVLGILGTLLVIQHRREQQAALSLRYYDDVHRLYVRTLVRHSTEHLQRYKPTFHPTSGQKRLLEELHYAGELIGAVRGHFTVDLENTVLDRNGNLELWVYTQEGVSEVFYIPCHAVTIVAGMFTDINHLFKQHLSAGVR